MILEFIEVTVIKKKKKQKIKKEIEENFIIFLLSKKKHFPNPNIKYEKKNRLFLQSI